MNLLVLGATGAVGSRVVREALSRGHAVTAASRAPARGTVLPPEATLRSVDAGRIRELEVALVGQDAAISALRPRPGHELELVGLTAAVLGAADRAGVPVVLVGGAASLRLPWKPRTTVLAEPGYLPDAVRPIAEACDAQRRMVLAHPSEGWSHLCPPAVLRPGPRTGRFRLGTDTLLVDAERRSRISLEDLAVALVDEAESGRHRGRSFTVGW